MSVIAVGEPIPDFRLPATGGVELGPADFAGQKRVVYFYPKDNTPGCTQEGQDFRDRYATFVESDCVVLGISRDGVKAHENFRAKHDFPFPLLSDKDEAVCQRFEVMKEKMMYGKPARGIERSTFLVDREGILRQLWRGVKVPGHVDTVLEAVRQLP